VTVASRRILFWNQGDLERKLENYKAYTINAGVTPGLPELRRLNGVAYPHGQSQTLNHTPGGTIAMVHFRHHLLHELEFDTDRAEINESEPPYLSVLHLKAGERRPWNRSLPGVYGSARVDSRRLRESLVITRDLARGERIAAMDARLEQRAGCRRVPTSLIGLYIFHGQ
jgi:hypothetical protein